MKKYYLIFKNSLQADLAYRFNVFALLLTELFTLLVLTYLWLSIYRQGNIIGDYSLSGLIIYYVLSRFINIIVNSHDIGREVGDTIGLGGIINYLTKPLKFINHIFMGYLAAAAYRIMAYSLIAIVAVIIISREEIYFNFFNLFYFIIFLAMGFIINFLIFYLVGIATFWLGYVAGFNFSVHTINSFLSGIIIPLNLLPPSIFKIANCLPFKYYAYVPISLITNKFNPTEIPFLIYGGLTWIIVLYFISVILYNLGIKKYEAYGN